MQTDIQSLTSSWRDELKGIESLKELEELKLKYLSKKGLVAGLMRGLAQASPQERPELGKTINELKQLVEQEVGELESRFKASALDEQLKNEVLDITLPGRHQKIGREHPVIKTLYEMLEVMQSLGFSVQLSPDIDNDFYNFEALNFPPEHPARDMQDTLYLPGGYLLRTQTSNAQVRLMEKMDLPLRVTVPGRCYRSETVTSRSHVLFHQVEGMYINETVSLGELLLTLEEFFKRLFKKEVEVRVRPSYFPFVEPGLEVDVSCLLCEAKGCSICKHTGWLEVAGAGMVHPRVLEYGGIDPKKYTGFAFAMGVERLVLLLNGIPDIRLFTENDQRFLKQFN